MCIKEAPEPLTFCSGQRPTFHIHRTKGEYSETKPVSFFVVWNGTFSKLVEESFNLTGFRLAHTTFRKSSKQGWWLRSGWECRMGEGRGTALPNPSIPGSCLPLKLVIWLWVVNSLFHFAGHGATHFSPVLYLEWLQEQQAPISSHFAFLASKAVSSTPSGQLRFRMRCALGHSDRRGMTFPVLPNPQSPPTHTRMTMEGGLEGVQRTPSESLQDLYWQLHILSTCHLEIMVQSVVIAFKEIEGGTCIKTWQPSSSCSLEELSLHVNGYIQNWDPSSVAVVRLWVIISMSFTIWS